MWQFVRGRRRGRSEANKHVCVQHCQLEGGEVRVAFGERAACKHGVHALKQNVQRTVVQSSRCVSLDLQDPIRRT
jgi:hypothetical protein